MRVPMWLVLTICNFVCLVSPRATNEDFKSVTRATRYQSPVLHRIGDCSNRLTNSGVMFRTGPKIHSYSIRKTHYLLKKQTSLNRISAGLGESVKVKMSLIMNLSEFLVRSRYTNRLPLS